MPSSDVHAEVLAAFLTKVRKKVTDLPDSDPEKAKYVAMGEAFTGGVAHLRDTFPNKPINKLMAFVWDIVGHNLAPVGCGPHVESLSFAIAGALTGNRKATIFMPHKWLDDITKDPLLQMGALVFVGSQAVDFYNDKLGVTQEQSVMSIKRARAYEAEYLLTLRKVSVAVTLNDYQNRVLQEYPSGLATPTVQLQGLLYSPKPFAIPSN